MTLKVEECLDIGEVDFGCLITKFFHFFFFLLLILTFLTNSMDSRDINASILSFKGSDLMFYLNHYVNTQKNSLSSNS